MSVSFRKYDDKPVHVYFAVLDRNSYGWETRNDHCNITSISVKMCITYWWYELFVRCYYSVIIP